MTALKTQPTAESVKGFLSSVEPERRRRDAFRTEEMMRRATGLEPVMWGSSIVGYGRYRYKRADGSRHGWFLTGFSPRKASLTVYIIPGFRMFERRLARLGPHRRSVSCLYIASLEKVDFGELSAIVSESVEWVRSKYETDPP